MVNKLAGVAAGLKSGAWVLAQSPAQERELRQGGLAAQERDEITTKPAHGVDHEFIIIHPEHAASLREGCVHPFEPERFERSKFQGAFEKLTATLSGVSGHHCAHTLAHVGNAYAGKCTAQCAGGFDGAEAKEAKVAAIITTISSASVKRLRAIFHHQNVRMLAGDFKN